MPLSDKKRISNDRWIKENYRQVKLSMPKSEAETLDRYCSTYNLSKAGFIREAIREKMERDASERPVDEARNPAEIHKADDSTNPGTLENTEKVVQVIVRPHQSEADDIKKAAVKACQSLQAYILQAVRTRMRQESDGQSTFESNK